MAFSDEKTRCNGDSRLFYGDIDIAAHIIRGFPIIHKKTISFIFF
ncbi:hypothetical protein MY9_0923 [Bacillus sp. JS]|nr:hypothetical protein MY9_0923 [Bacillus sp. JS]